MVRYNGCQIQGVTIRGVISLNPAIFKRDFQRLACHLIHLLVVCDLELRLPLDLRLRGKTVLHDGKLAEENSLVLKRVIFSGDEDGAYGLHSLN